MTNEEKQALTGLCKIEIKRWKAASESNPNMRYMVELMKVALTALTAQPIELPQRYSCEGYHIDEAYLVADEDGDCFDRDEVIEKLRQQGYEVQE